MVGVDRPRCQKQKRKRLGLEFITANDLHQLQFLVRVAAKNVKLFCSPLDSIHLK